MRFFIEMFSHKTNTFSIIVTDRRQFEARDLHHGGEILEGYRGTGTCLGGMIGVAETRGRLLADLGKAGSRDGVLLDLHGAMVPEGSEDGEGEPGRVYACPFALYPTANRFRAGHRIRLDVSSSSYPRFDVNPNTGDPLWANAVTRVAVNTIHHDAAHPSHLTLPLLDA